MANGVSRNMPKIEICESQYLPTNIDSKKTRLDKNIWGKWVGVIVNILEEHIMNPLGISWEHIGNKKNATNPTSLDPPQNNF